MKSWIRWLFAGLFLFLLVQGKPVIWLILYGGSLLVALVWGRIYCGYICPMNTVMIPVQKGAQKIGLQKKYMPGWLRTAWLPVLMLLLSLAVMVIGRKQGLNVPILPIWLLAAVLITIVYRSEGFHNGICPFSPLQKLFGQKPRYSFSVEKDQCIRCGRCVQVCPSRAVQLTGPDGTALIQKSLCHQCGECAAACPADAIHYRS